MSASSLVAFALATSLGLAQGFWAVITALIVTQGSIGGSLKAALDRFVGSVSGAVYGGAVALAVPHESVWVRGLTLIAAVAPLSVMATFSAGFRVAPITAIIVLLTPAGATLGPVGFAFDRILEIGLGCGVGLLVSVLIVPALASDAVLQTAARVGRLLAGQVALLAAPDERSQPKLAELALQSREGLARLETLVAEAARERRSHLTSSPDPEPLYRTLRRLRHDVFMLRRAVQQPIEGELAPAWARVAEDAAASLGALSEALAGRQEPIMAQEFHRSFASFRAEADRATQGVPTAGPSSEATGRIFAAAFAMDQFRRDLDDWAERVQDFSAGAEANA